MKEFVGSLAIGIELVASALLGFLMYIIGTLPAGDHEAFSMTQWDWVSAAGLRLALTLLIAIAVAGAFWSLNYLLARASFVEQHWVVRPAVASGAFIFLGGSAAALSFVITKPFM
jgi:hypothetical protein